MQLLPKAGDYKARNDKTETLHSDSKIKTKTRKLDDSEYIQEETECDRIARMKTLEEQLSQEWKSEILDCFYSNQLKI